METQEQVKELAREKYSEIALQDKKLTFPHVLVLVVAVQKYITSWLMIIQSWKVIILMLT